MGLCDCYLYGAPFDDEMPVGMKVLLVMCGVALLLAPIGNQLEWAWFV